jgi:hypothetical protein
MLHWVIDFGRVFGRTLHYTSNITGRDKSREVRSVGHVARMGEMRYAYNVLVRKSERKRTL